MKKLTDDWIIDAGNEIHRALPSDGDEQSELLEIVHASITEFCRINGLTEAETNASASVMGLTRPAAKPEDIPAIFKEQAS